MLNPLRFRRQGSASSTSDRSRGVAAGLLLIAVGLSVRFPITSVSPLLENLRAAFDLSLFGPSVISAIPVLLFGLISPIAPLLVSRWGTVRAMEILMCALALATLFRPVNGALLYFGTVVVGASIALLGILAPQLIREHLPHRAGFWTGIYTTAFGVSAAVGAGVTIPVFQFLDERVAVTLAAWGAPLLLATAISLLCAARLRSLHTEVASIPPTFKGIFGARGLWSVTGFFGCQAMIYFSLTAWLPTIAMHRGMSPSQAGFLLALMSIAGLPSSLIAPMLAARESWRPVVIFITALLSAVGLAGLAFAPVSYAYVMVVILGIAQSAAFGLSIALIVFTAPNVQSTATFSAISQGVGYAFAAIGPLGLGMLAQVGVSWTGGVACLLLLAVGELIFGFYASRKSVSAHSSENRNA